ncbi:uncharacterized protein LOC113673808 isoform X1 [Pocillopora damicornis]|uniref:uncharacterized protein LOC113673808 isoform X1 n=1 Tax=Pocillopora damicornis TaxID=46731 RepID=UPI000F55420F|nr:uncharacterized protein LOC113673808 isoform X1 [Pocillopora damicornis]
MYCKVTNNLDKMWKIIVLLVLLVTITAAKLLDDGKPCLGKSCWLDSECPQCSETKQVICHYGTNTCREIEFWDKIIRRKPCHRYFKSACRVTADCHCDGKLICEDNECVVNRTNEDIRARRH